MLGRILLLQNGLHVAPDEQRLAEMAVHGLDQIPGAAGTTICLNGRIVATTVAAPRPSGTCAAGYLSACNGETRLECPLSPPDGVERCFRLATSRFEFGVLQFLVTNLTAFEPYTPFVSNTANLIALQLENGRTTEQLQSANLMLESQVEEQSIQYRRLFENMAEGVVYQDEQGRIVSANPSAVRILGLSEAELVGSLSTEYRTPIIREDGSSFPVEAHPTMIALRTGNSVNDRIMGVFNPLTADYVWLNINAVPLFRPGENRPRQVFATFRDVTEHRRAEEALRKSEAKLRGILDNIGIGVALISLEMEIVELNHRMREWFGEVKPGELCYRVFGMPSHDCICTDCPVRATLSDGQVHEMPVMFQLKGHEHTFRVIASPLLGSAREISAVIVLYEDITEKISLESQLRQAQKMEAVGRLAGGIAHDFNNMLGVILGYTELALQTAEPDQEFGMALREVRQAALRSADLTKQLLAFARKQIVAPRVLDLNTTIEGMLQMLRRLIGENITLAWLPKCGLWLVRVDPSQVDQILANLCVNSRDAIAGVGKIIIETRNIVLDELFCADHTEAAPGDYVLLTVSDNGCGMDRKTMERLFEPFFTTKEAGKGTGLGLSTVYGIVKQNRGFVDVYSEPGLGATFKAYFPRFADEPVVSKKEDTPLKTATGDELVLLVEDEPAILDMTRFALERFGYRVMAAASPEEALNYAFECTERIALLITDVVMPQMNGLQLARKLHSFYPAIRVLFMSGYTSEVIAHQGILNEGVDYLQKPFNIQTLAEKVREVLDRE